MEKMLMKFVCLSDTHGLNDTAYSMLKNFDADVLLFAGDFSNWGTLLDCVKFNQMLQKLPMKYKVVIAGNHDLAVDMYNFTDDVIYLKESEVIIEGIKIYGSPWTPMFCNWAFMAYPDELKKRWSKIPDDVDILLTHGPPFGTLDMVDSQIRKGDEELALRIKQLLKLKHHVFGHLHFGYGEIYKNGIHYINCSMLNEINQPITFEV